MFSNCKNNVNCIGQQRPHYWLCHSVTQSSQNQFFFFFFYFLLNISYKYFKIKLYCILLLCLLYLSVVLGLCKGCGDQFLEGEGNAGFVALAFICPLYFLSHSI